MTQATVNRGLNHQLSDLASTDFARHAYGAASMLLAVCLRIHEGEARDVFQPNGDIDILPIQGTSEFYAWGEDGSEWIVDMGDEIGRGRYARKVLTSDGIDTNHVYLLPNYRRSY